MVLVRDRPSLPACDDRQWTQVAGYAGINFRKSLALFTLRRAEVVAMLGRVVAGDWARSGVHEEHGPISLNDLL